LKKRLILPEHDLEMNTYCGDPFIFLFLNAMSKINAIK
jgi:hypothetical protein